jgi:hypothetical protein
MFRHYPPPVDTLVAEYGRDRRALAAAGTGVHGDRRTGAPILS